MDITVPASETERQLYATTSKAGQSTILRAIAETSGASEWDDVSAQSHLLGLLEPRQSIRWTWDQLEAFQNSKIAAWVLRWAGLCFHTYSLPPLSVQCSAAIRSTQLYNDS